MQNNTFLVAVGIAVLLAAGYLVLAQPLGLPLPQPPGGGVACTEEAKICPDGSAVGRTGPNCQFVCPGGGGGSILPYTSGIRGTIMLGPTCPVERDPPDPNCADKPYKTQVAIYRASDLAHAIVQTQSDAQGKFETSLPPGQYSVGVGERTSMPSCPSTAVAVAPDVYTSVVINCDSGIR